VIVVVLPGLHDGGVTPQRHGASKRGGPGPFICGMAAAANSATSKPPLEPPLPARMPS